MASQSVHVNLENDTEVYTLTAAESLHLFNFLHNLHIFAIVSQEEIVEIVLIVEFYIRITEDGWHVPCAIAIYDALECNLVDSIAHSLVDGIVLVDAVSIHFEGEMTVQVVFNNLCFKLPIGRS